MKWDGSATSVRKKLYHLLKDTPARALLLNQVHAIVNVKEYIYEIMDIKS